MEYEFRRNSLDGTATAIFSMDHEVLGRWFTEELGQDEDIISELMNVISTLQEGQAGYFQLVGGEFTLEMDFEQVRIFANVIGFNQDYDLEDGMSLYDAESSGSCGLDDFATALVSWRNFLATAH
ncbi:YacL family protein [Shewanella sp. NIFS-20-20]|uniref:YacL family protein n=1 Tax=Shewanella sp. NIFS-20-20 TaxID=2853806 RepID=UPI001C43DBED|nr:YacL family protein [Shewanella sp. NIFS-20-20]MBV7315827.1 YacL family protein [Shewanella sp. NIFS-20-20]